MKKAYWITMQKPGDKEHRLVWVSNTPRNIGRAKEVKRGDLIAVYVDKEDDTPGGIKYIGEIDCRIDEPDGEWIKLAKLKRKLLANNDDICPLDKLAPILEPNYSFDNKNKILAVKRKCGRTVGKLNENQISRIWGSFPDYSSCLEEINNNRLANSAETEDEPEVPGFPSQKVKKAVEQYAVKKAENDFKQKGFKVESYEKSSSYDLKCVRRREEYYIEVKGTQNPKDRAAVFLTAKEVEHARQNKASSKLYIVHSIKVNNVDGKLKASGGEMCIKNWSGIEEQLKICLYKFKVFSSGD